MKERYNEYSQRVMKIPGVVGTGRGRKDQVVVYVTDPNLVNDDRLQSPLFDVWVQTTSKPKAK